MLSILHIGGPQVLDWVKLRHSVSQLFLKKYSSRGLSPHPSKAACMKTVVIFLYCASLLKQKVRGYPNTSAVYIFKKRKGKYSYQNSSGTGFFISAFPMINEAPAHTWKLTAEQRDISKSSPRHMCADFHAVSDSCRILVSGKSRAAAKLRRSITGIKTANAIERVCRDMFI